MFLGGLAVLLVVLIVGCLGDDPLSPEAEAALTSACPAVAPEDNIYIGIAGLGFPKDGDVIEAGQKYLNTSTQDQAGSYSGSGDYDFSYLNPCLQPAAQNCLAQIAADRQLIERDIRRNQKILERYQVIKNMGGYANCSGPWAPVPMFNALLGASKLTGAKALLDIKDGNIEAGLASLEKDLALHAKIAKSDSLGLIDLMVIVAALEYNLTALSNMIADPTVDLRGYEDRLRKMLDLDLNFGQIMEAALSGEKRSIVKMLDGNAPQGLVSSPSNDYLSQGERRLMDFSSLLYKINMTRNNVVSKFENDISLIKQTPLLHFPAFYTEHMAAMPKSSESGVFDIKKLYGRNGIFFYKNYVGDILIEISSMDYMKYEAKLAEVITHTSLVRAQLELRLMPDRKVSVAEALAQFGPETLNPYTDKPFEWDQANKILWVVRPSKAGESDDTGKNKAMVLVPSARL